MRNFLLRFTDVDAVTKAAIWLGIVAAVCIAAMLIVNVVDIVAAKWFRWSVPGALDITEDLMVFMTLLPLALIALERGHIRITLLEDRLSQRGRFALKVLRYVVGILITGFITWRVFIHFQYTIKVMILKEGLDMPIWPASLAVVISFGLLALVWILLLVKTLKAGPEQ